MPKLIKQYSSQQVDAEADRTTSFALYAADYPDISFQRTDGKVKGWIVPVAQGPNNEDEIVAETNVTVGLATTTKKNILPYNFTSRIRPESYTISVVGSGNNIIYMDDADIAYFKQIANGTALPPKKVIIPEVFILGGKNYLIDNILNYIVPLYRKGYFTIEKYAFFTNPAYNLINHYHFLVFIPMNGVIPIKPTLNTKYLCNPVLNPNITNYYIVGDFKSVDVSVCDSFLHGVKQITITNSTSNDVINILPFLNKIDTLENLNINIQNTSPEISAAFTQYSNLMDNVNLNINFSNGNFSDLRDLLLEVDKGKITVGDSYVDLDEKKAFLSEANEKDASTLVDVTVEKKLIFRNNYDILDSTSGKNILTMASATLSALVLSLAERLHLIDVINRGGETIYDKENNPENNPLSKIYSDNIYTGPDGCKYYRMERPIPDERHPYWCCYVTKYHIGYVDYKISCPPQNSNYQLERIKTPLPPPPVTRKPVRGSVTKTTNSITLTYHNGIDTDGSIIPYFPANYIVVDGYIISSVNKGKEMLTPNAIVKWVSGNGTETITVVKKFDPRKNISIVVGRTKIGEL